jgi:hypothetical protein
MQSNSFPSIHFPVMNHKPQTPVLPKKLRLSSLGGLGGSHLLAVLVVSDTGGRGTVAAADSRTDTTDTLLVGACSRCARGESNVSSEEGRAGSYRVQPRLISSAHSAIGSGPETGGCSLAGTLEGT